MSQLEQRQMNPNDLSSALTHDILGPELRQRFETLRALLQRALWLAERCGDQEATQILRSKLTNLQSAALLVIVGEVKVGKSSFVNALVREDVCEVAPGPCTRSIQELVFGVERTGREPRPLLGEVVSPEGSAARSHDRGYAGNEFDHSESRDDH